MNWPTRDDGQNKTVGEMTPDERKAILEPLAARVVSEAEQIMGQMAERLAEPAPPLAEVPFSLESQVGKQRAVQGSLLK